MCTLHLFLSVLILALAYMATVAGVSIIVNEIQWNFADKNVKQKRNSRWL